MSQTQVETKSVPILEIREMLREVIRMQTRIDPRLITLDARLKQDLGINDDVRACIIRELEWLCDAKAPDSLFSPEVQKFQDIAQCMFESYAKESRENALSTFASAYEHVTGCPVADVGYGMWLYRDLSIDGITLIEIAEKLRMMGYPVNDASVGSWARVSDAVSSLGVLHRNTE